MTGKVYPVGYSHLGADKRIEELMQQDTMLLIDGGYDFPRRAYQSLTTCACSGVK